MSAGGVVPPHCSGWATTNPAEPFSLVNSSSPLNGSNVEPSMLERPVVPSCAGGESSVMRWAGSFTSRLMRVRYALPPPFSCPWKRKWRP